MRWRQGAPLPIFRASFSKRILIVALSLMTGFASFGESSTPPEVEIQPEHEIIGFTISRVPAKSLYEKIGLKAGDTISMINKTHVVTEFDMDDLTEALQNDRPVTLQIIRKGKVIVLHVKPPTQN